MNVEYINPFIKGANSIITTICGETPTIGKMFLKVPPYKCLPACILVCIQGGVNGNIIYTMETQTACTIASRMIGMTISALDEISQSALEEFANMISGSAATAFVQMGLTIQVSSPKFLTNTSSNDFTFITPASKFICIPLIFQDNSVFEVDVLFT